MLHEEVCELPNVLFILKFAFKDIAQQHPSCIQVLNLLSDITSAWSVLDKIFDIFKLAKNLGTIVVNFIIELF